MKTNHDQAPHTARLQYVAKPRRGHVQVFDGRRLRYLVTGYARLEVPTHIETLYGPLPTPAERIRITSKAHQAMGAAISGQVAA